MVRRAHSSIENKLDGKLALGRDRPNSGDPPFEKMKEICCYIYEGSQLRYNGSNKKDCEDKKLDWIAAKDRENVGNRDGQNELPMIDSTVQNYKNYTKPK